MTDTVETVTIKAEDGSPLRINATDFDSKKHDLHKDDKNYVPSTELNTFDAPAENPVPASAPVMSDGYNHPGAHVANPEGTVEGDGERRVVLSEPVASSSQAAAVRRVGKFGNKWFVVDDKGAKITGDDINESGYKTELEANQAAWPAAYPKQAEQPAG